MLAIFLIGAGLTRNHQGSNSSDFFTLLLLATFLAAFFIPSTYYGFTDPMADLKEGIVILLCYGSGLLWGRQTGAWSPGIWLLVAMASGFTIFAALTTFTNPAQIATFLNPDRSAPNFWLGGEAINGTVLGLYASLGLCLIPPALLWSTGDGKSHFLARTGLVLIAGLGFATNLVMQNRSPYIALGLAFLLCGWIYFRNAAESAAKRIGGLLLRLSPLLVAGLVLVILSPDFITGILFQRFGEQGGDTGGRVQAWIAVLHDLPFQPFGGKVIHIGGLRFAHNLWMDAAYNSGLVALLALLLFHLAHLPFIVRFYRRRPPSIELLAATAIGVSMFMGCMVEPVLDASRLYLGGTCFLLAWMKSRSENLDARGRRA